MSGNKLPSFEELKKMQQQQAQKAGKPALPSFEDLQKMKKAATKAAAAGPKKKKALKLDVFKQKSGAGGHALFYRYIRVKDPKNDDLAGPKGGATILVDMLNDDSFRFSFSECSMDDAFIKDEARNLCQSRFEKGFVCVVTGRNREASCFENILNAIERKFNVNLAGPSLACPSNITNEQLKGLRRYIRKLMAGNAITGSGN